MERPLPALRRVPRFPRLPIMNDSSLPPLEKFSAANILVIGDVIVDHFIWGEVNRISPEAPVPVVDVRREDLLLGGAANVLSNIRSLGGRATICGVVGDDAMADTLAGLIAGLGSPTAGIVRSGARPTMVKTRVIAHHQQVVRFDREKRHDLNDGELARVIAFLDRHLAEFDAVVVSDYAKGVVCAGLMDALHARLRSLGGRPLIIDPKPKAGRMQLFAGATVITPNNGEAEQLAGMSIRSEADLQAAAARLLEELRLQAVLITRGEAGMALLERGRQLFTIPTKAREVFDVTGAGDTVVAVLALGLAAGMDLRRAANLANHAAGIVVGKLGTATVSIAELQEAIR
ncbi:MAG: D-glycero-beta-D-manno-heptose-7-phosphate kinase [Thermodesulfobacteriota bacterium]